MKNKFPMFYVELKDKINYYKAIEEGDKGKDGAIVHYIANLLMEQYTHK
jgi:hypothetical protein